MKKYLFIISAISLFILVSCKGGEDNVIIPSGIIPPDTMVYVLADFHLAEAAIMEKQLQQKDTKQYTNYYYAILFEKYKINHKQFNEAIVFYSSHPKLYREIYDKVLEELSRIQAESMR